jgi:hypothetical protein
VTAALPGTVVITRPRHPLHGRELRVLGGMRRHGDRELLVVLPDGSKRLVPASWAGLELPAGGQAGDGPGTLGPVADLLGLSVLVSALSARSRDGREQAARKPPAREDDRAACSAQSAAGTGSGATAGSDRPASRPAGRSGHHTAGGPDRQGAGRRGDSGGGR